jgi:hypothetical protein
MTANAHPQLNAALFGRYSIERELGAGGMATVYLANDVRHDRKVAVKVLRPELAAVVGAERFLAEIRTTANLQHPHVLALFDSGQVDGTVFYVMPFVDGESLRDRLKREKQLPIDDALRIAREVGDALHYAHGHGVIHRDIKPENILLQGGHALVADFGIALAAAKTGGSRMTETGMSLGTPRYMSPEQAMGERTIDARTDIYALGCVLYEMLVGDAPFTGSTAQAIVAKVLTDKPAPIIAHRERVPQHVEDAVLTALEKLPADRFATAAEFVASIGSADAVSSATSRGRTASRRATAARRTRALVVVAGATVVAAGLGGWLIGRGARSTNVQQPARLALVEPGMGPAFSGVARSIDISADGQTVVYSARHPLGIRILVRRLDGTAPGIIASSSGNSFHLRLSRDARNVYASQGASMHSIPLAGGAWTPTGLEPTSFLHFTEDGILWWGSMLSYGSFRRADGRDSLVFPRSTITQVLPGGRYGLGVGVTTGANSGSAQWLDLRTGQVKNIFETPIIELRYTLGYIVYVRPDGSLVAAPFDERSGTVTGAHVEIANNVSVSGIGFAQYAVSDNGTVVYVPGFNNDLVRVSRTGETRVLLSELRRYHSPRISPDGRRIAYDDVTPDGRDVWIVNEGTRDITRATFQLDGHDVAWAPDGRGIYYVAGNGGKLDIFRAQLGSTAPAKPLGTRAELSYTGTPLPRGGFLTTVPGASGRGLDLVRVTDSAAIDTILATPADESFVVPSPDGRWFAYTSDHSGRPELYLRSLGGSDVHLAVSLDGASEPVWSRDGSELFYRRPTANGAELVSATLSLGLEPRVVKRTALFDVSGFDTASPHANFDVSPDGRWFVFARRSGADYVMVLQNLPELVRRTAPTGATP